MPPTVRPGVTVQNVGEESLVLDLESEQIHQLNSTAAWILQQCDGERPVSAIVSEFAACFSLEADVAERDVTGTLEKLSEIQIIDLD